MSKRRYHTLFKVIAISLLVGIFIGYAGNNRDVLGFLDNYLKPQVTREVNPVLISDSEVATCFTPPSGCGAVIANQISKAQESIYVQAYGFTSGEITKALINANNRGVKVRVLLDKSNIGAKYSKMRDLRKAGFAHNKIIIDGSAVITGSFNFTTSADIRNTENVIIVQNKPLAQKYLQNWHARYEMSHARITKN
ncbi:MAG: phospholipase D family protein [Rickettsiaceae bacterium]|jgi:phospholipase D|nr:phospholipase D family protein [Rickettsiaceae bacterium]